jgi:pimeloyl-ACP methyl ester carboxylesterase
MMPLLHPARTAGVIGVNTPYIPRLPIAPIALFRQALGDNHYIVHFQQRGVADRALARDVRRVFTRLMRTGVALEDLHAATGGVVRNLVEVIESDLELGAPILSAEEIDVYTAAFERTGFTGPLNWYRNMDRNWETTAALADARIDVPSLMVTAELDPVLRPELAEPMRAVVPDLEIAMIPGCGHWTQQEKPAELNAVMVDWLRRRFGGGRA